MRVFLAEKPSLGQAIAKGLGIFKRHDGYISDEKESIIVTWCFGHILEQCPPDAYDPNLKKWSLDTIPIIPEKWKLQVSKDCKKQFNIVKNLINKADEIINAGDPDREGQLLVDEVINYVGCTQKPTKRVLLNALDDTSVKKALANLDDNKNYVGLRNAALARSRADWVIGMNLTRAYTLKMQEAGYTGVVNVGRVKTPTMSLVVRREKEIKSFVPKNFFTLDVIWDHKKGKIESTWRMKDTVPNVDEEGRLLNKDFAEKVLEKIQSNPSTSSIKKVIEEQKQEAQPLPFSLSALQIAAGKKFGYDPKKVLSIMQSLYEKKYTTYPRSDCDYLPTNQLPEAKTIVTNLTALLEIKDLAAAADLDIKSRAWNDKKISAHHAIIPTLEKINTTNVTDEEFKMYLLVAKTYLAQFFQPHKYLAKKIVIASADEDFIATGKTVIDDGWKKIFKKDATDNSNEKEKILPDVKEGESVSFISGEVITKETKPPVRFTASTLIKAMKEIHKYLKDPDLRKTMKDCSGIGTEATRATIIDELIKSGILSVQKKNLIPTDKAFELTEVLSDEITYPDSTAIWENKLDLISKKELAVNEFLEYQNSIMREWISQAKKVKIKASQSVVACPSCNKPMVRRKGQKGYFWGCTGYPECKITALDEKGKPNFNKKTSPGQTSDVKCPNCGKPMIRRPSNKDPKKFWWGCSGYKDGCKTTAFDKNGKPVFDDK